MSTALYRRYRPETFAEVIGQEHVTGPLSAALERNRISHAYLFSGPRGCGKTTSARILARCLNCVNGPTATPCGECESCVALARGGSGSIDVIEIDAASHRGIDDAREIRDRAIFAPASSRFKIFIIDEAHMVTKEGFNALLKIVEEPPEHVKFVFATTEPDKVIGTIRSRTHHYPFRLVPPGALQEYLGQLCEAEGVQVGAGVLPLVVRAGGGSVRDTLSVLDQLIGGAGEEGVTYPLAISLLGYTDATLLDDVVEALAAADGRTAFQMVEKVIDSGLDPRRFVEDLLERLRDLLVVAAVPDGAHAVLRGLPADQLQRMQGQAGAFGAAELSRAADVANAALTDMTGATSPRLHLELLIARLLLPGADDAQRGLPARLDRLERRIGMAGPATAAPMAAPAPVVSPAPSASSATPHVASPAPEPAPAAQTPAPASGGPAGRALPSTPAPEGQAEQAPPAPVPSTARSAAPASAAATSGAPAAGAMDVAALRQAWPGVLEALRPLKRATWALLTQDAQVLQFDGRHLVLGFSSTGLATSFGRGTHADLVRQALSAHLGLDCTVEGVAGGGGGGRAEAPRSAGPAPTPAPAPSGPAPAAPAAPSAPAPAPVGAPRRPGAARTRTSGAGPLGGRPCRRHQLARGAAHPRGRTSPARRRRRRPWPVPPAVPPPCPRRASRLRGSRGRPPPGRPPGAAVGAARPGAASRRRRPPPSRAGRGGAAHHACRSRPDR
ncbi:MAG: DNA polymerase III subunit gamma and tau [Kineosporiaceae bacterium]